MYKSNGMFLDNHSEIFGEKQEIHTANSDNMCQQAQFEHKNTIVNTRIHGIVLQI